MRALTALITLATIAAVSTPAFAGPITSRPTFSRPTYSSPVRSSPTVRPSTTQTTKTATASRTSSTSRARPFSYAGRHYTPSYNNGVMFLLWYTILSNGNRQEHRINCDYPRTDAERRACDQAN